MILICPLLVNAQERDDYYTNPILPSGADPWVIKHDGWYYYCGSMSGGIGVSRSRDLHKINPLSRVWKAPEKGQWNSSCIWAPEIHFWKGKWYILYAAGYSGPPFIHQKTGVLESVTSDAMGEYVDKGMLFTGDVLGDWKNNRWAIDMTLLEHNGQLYAVWSGWEDAEPTDKTQQHLYIAKMENPWTISSGRVKISSPDQYYEQGELPLNEGPQILKHGKDLFIIYSCGQSWLDTYKLSCLRLKDTGADLLNPESWLKSEKPIFEGTDSIFGVGHASFTTSLDEKEYYILYHTKKEKAPGWKRDVRLQKFIFDHSGMPYFGKPVSSGKKLPLPSGTKPDFQVQPSMLSDVILESYFPLKQIRLLDSPFLTLQQKGKEYLLWLEPDSLLHFYRIEAGLPPKAEAYAGWESQDVWGAGPLRGGFLGFYLSSVSMMYQSTGDKELLRRLKYVLRELRQCQDAGKDGFLLGVKDGRKLFKEVAAGKIKTNNPTVNGAWAPVYLINKMLLGLSAAYTQCDLKEALPIMIRLAEWFGYQVLDKLSDEQIQQLLVCEHGSINESYVEAYELTGEKRFLEWARRLNDRAMWVPLSQGKDILFGWHANTQIPKFTGFHKYYMFTGDNRFLSAATNFWNIVNKNHTWVIGGNSTGEHFFPKEEFAERLLLKGGPETCNSVNMLRLTESLFSQCPDAVKASYYERVLFNHILSAYDPEKGMCCYFTSMRPGHYRIYASRDSSFWCCGHTGLESPAKLGKFIYSHKATKRNEEKEIRVNLFIPSVLTWREGGVELVQRNRLPGFDQVELTMNLKKKQRLILRIRKPDWAGKATLIINGKVEQLVLGKDGYWMIDKIWNRKNMISLQLPMHIYTENLIGTDRYVALLYGPYVLAGRLGKENLPPTFWGKMNNTAMNKLDLSKVPVFSIPVSQIPAFVKPVFEGDALRFNIDLEGFENIVVEPFYKIHFERYAIYWPMASSH